MPIRPLASLAVNALWLVLIAAMATAWAWAIVRNRAKLPLLARSSTGPRRVGGRVVAMVVLLYVGLQQVVPGAVVSILGLKPRGEDGPRVAILASLGLDLAFLALAIPLVRALRRPARSGSGPDDPPRSIGRSAIAGLVAWPLVVPLVYGAQAVALLIWPRGRHPVEDWLSADGSAAHWAISALMAVLVAPLTEEFLFRGVLLNWLDGRSGDRPVAANVLTSLLFAGLHAAVWPSPVPIFVLSLALGFLYQRTAGLIAPLTLHATFNGISTLSLLLILLARDPATTPPPPTPPPPIEISMGRGIPSGPGDAATVAVVTIVPDPHEAKGATLRGRPGRDTLVGRVVPPHGDGPRALPTLDISVDSRHGPAGVGYR